jgi:lipid A ethanolaminephosphotransferase
MKKFKKLAFSQQTLFHLTFALYFFYAFNHNLFLRITENSEQGFFFTTSKILLFFLIIFLTLNIFDLFRKVLRDICYLFFITTAALTAYYSDAFNIIFSSDVILSVINTDWREAKQFLSVVYYLIFSALIPLLLIIKFHPKKSSLKEQTLRVVTALLLIFVVLGFSFKDFKDYFRNNRIDREYFHPFYAYYSAIKAAGEDRMIVNANDLKDPIHITQYDKEKNRKKILVMVVGETARADHFSLNGYSKQTNPLLEKQDLINFNHFYSCGTFTKFSLPCMFSFLKRVEFSYQKAFSQKNVLEVLQEQGVNVSWRDNNSDSKGVALRIKYEDFQTPQRNNDCTNECHDDGLLNDLDHEISPIKDNIIVLHAIGNHGPHYYKRYPAEFERFTPVCKLSHIQNCPHDQLVNAYDNAILYTDYFLNKTIETMKAYEDKYDVSVIYIADHGESLGEHGKFMHASNYGLYEAEIHVPAFIWLGKGQQNLYKRIKLNSQKKLSHDTLSCSLINLFEMESDKCQGILFND